MLILLLFITILIHLLFTLIAAIAITKWESKSNMDQPKLSIIIAARNEVENLKLLLPALLKQDYPDYEIIIGLDRCDDGSVELLESYENSKIQWIDIRKVADGWNSKKYALNCAISKSVGSWLIFTDADCIPSTDQWLGSISRETSEDTNIILGISPYLSAASFLSKFIRFEAFMTYFLYAAFTMLGRPYMAVGRNMAVRRSFFQNSDGYQQIKHIVGGDDDLFIQKSARTGISMMLGKNSTVNTKPSKWISEYWHQKTRHLSVGKHYVWQDTLFLTAYHTIHLSVYPMLLFNIGNICILPIILFFLFIKLASYRFVASKIGAGFNYILFPFVEILYAIITPVLGIRSQLKKDIKWKN